MLRLSLPGGCPAPFWAAQQPRRGGAALPRSRVVPARAQSGGEGQSDRELESQFERELRRRGLDPSAPGSASPGDSYGAAPRSPFEQQQQQRAAPRPPPSFRGQADDTVPPQLQYSRALNSEGLEGFIPRATELLKLGGTFFLAFLPFILVVSLGFGAVYALFGESFVHGGAPSSGPPVYYDADALLAEPTADPMVPLDLR